jgi:hypothetical protein
MSENKQDILNRSMPAAYKVKLGSTLDEIIAAYNDLATKYNATLAKLDLDTGVAGTDYAALGAVTSTALKDLNSR